MKSRLARTAGFCMGVRRAVEIVLDTANKKKGEVFTQGPLIHNPQVLELLEGKQVRALEEGERPQGGTVVIRAHGVPPEMRQKMRSWGVELKDATCPNVARVQGIIKKHAHQGYHTVIVGDKGHPEVSGLLGYAEGRGHVIGSLEDIESLPPMEKVCLVAQTTQNTVLFDSVERAFKERFPEAKIFNTICDSTQERQKEVQALARSVDAMVVVGGRMSGNTKRLADLSASQGTPTYLVETEEELRPELLNRYHSIGITAGASTPHWMIRRVVERIESMDGEEGRSLRGALRVFLSLLLRTNGALTLGALGLTLAATELQGLPLRFSLLVVPVLYLFAMHSINRWQNIASDRFNQPARARFYERWGWVVLALAGGAILLALVLAGRAGLGGLIFLLFALSAGVLYNLNLHLPVLRWFGFEEIPGSKCFWIALAWGLSIVLYPLLAAPTSASLATGLAFSFVFALAFVRAAFFELWDVQGDRIIGRETLPILIGSRRTLLIMGSLVALVALTLAAGGILGLKKTLSWGLLASLGWLALILLLSGRGWLSPGSLGEGLVEAQFPLVGLITLLWLAL